MSDKCETCQVHEHDICDDDVTCSCCRDTAERADNDGCDCGDMACTHPDHRDD